MSDKVSLAIIRAKPGTRDEIMRIWKTKAEDYMEHRSGFRSVYFAYDDNDPDGIIIFILGDDAAAADFKQQPWFSDYATSVHDLFAEPSISRTGSPKFAKGIQLK